MRRKLSKWHRRIGLLSLGLLSWLAVTGVLLNHARLFGLDTPIGAPWIADLYGIESRCATSAWNLEDQRLIDCGDSLLLDEQLLPQTPGPSLGALRWTPDINAVAVETGLLLLTPAGERIEWISTDLLPGRPLRLGRFEQGLILQTPAGIFAANEMLDQWQSLRGDENVHWAHTAPLDRDSLSRAQSLAAVGQLSWGKLIQDLHSGRIIGLAGTILADLGALSIIVLAILGLFMTRTTTARRHQAPAAPPADAGRDDTPSA